MKPKGKQNEAYLEFVRRHASCLSWESELLPIPSCDHEGLLYDDDSFERQSVAHHVRMGGRGGMGMKPTDYCAVPLTDGEHKLLHQHGEAGFWAINKVDPNLVMARLLCRWLGYDFANFVRKNFGEDDSQRVSSRHLTDCLIDDAKAARLRA